MSEKWLNRRTMTWAGYDVASSVFVGLAPSVLMPLYVKHLVPVEADSTAAWGMLAAVAILSSGLAALAAAAAAVRVPRFPLLVLATLCLVAAMAMLAVNPGNSLMQAGAAYIVALSFSFAATAIYESFLPDLLPPALRHKLSGFGWAIGYAGGVIAIVTLLVLVSGQPESAGLLQSCFAVLALIAALLFAPVLIMMWREGFGARGLGRETIPRSGLVSVLAAWRAHRVIYQLLAGAMLVQMAVSVVVLFTAPILAARFGQTLPDLLLLVLVVHVMAVPSTLAWNALTGGRARLLPMAVLLLAWGGVILLLAFGSGAAMPFIIVSAIGCCLGGILAALRGFLAEAIQPADSVAFFGLATVVGRFAAAMGPALFAAISLAAGQTIALVAMLLVLLAGAALLLHLLARNPMPGQAAPRPARHR